MVLVYAAVFILLVILSAVFLGRFFAWLVELIAQYVLHLELCIDSFGMLSVNGIKVKLKGNKIIKIERISLHTRWTFANPKKLFTILLSNVSLVFDTRGNQSLEKSTKSTKSSNKFVASHKERISRFIQKCCQYVAVSVSQVEVLLKADNHKVIKCRLQEGLELVANPVGTRLVSIISLNKIVAQLSNVHEEKTNAVEHLAECSVAMVIEATLQPLESIRTADINVHLKSLGVLFSDALIIKDSLHLGDAAITSPAECDENVTETEPKLLEGNEVWSKLARAPVHVELSVDGTNVTVLNQDKRKLTVDIGRIVITFSQERNEVTSTNSCNINLGISGVSVIGTKPCKLCILNRLRLQAKLSNHDGQTQLSSSLSIESFHNNYVHEECSYWLEYFKSRTKKNESSSIGVQTKESGIKSGPPFSLPLELEVEMVDCSTSLYLKMPLRNEQPLFRAVLASFVTTVSVPKQDLYQTSGEVREVSGTMRLENAYVYVDTAKSVPELVNPTAVSYTLPDNPGMLPSTNRHVWGRVLALGSCSVKCSVEAPFAHGGDAMHVKSRVEASCLVMEWSQLVCRTVLRVVKRFTGDTSKKEDKKLQNIEGNNEKRRKLSVDADVRVSAINVFYLGTRQEGLDSFVMRTDMVTVATPIDSRVHVDVCGVKISRMVGLQKSPYRCVHSAELDNQFLNIPVLTVSLAQSKDISISLNQAHIDWSPTVHMALNDRIQEVTDDSASILALLRRSDEPILDSSPQEAHQELHLQCEISSFRLRMQTSPSTSFGVELCSSVAEIQSNSLHVTVDMAAAFFDDQCILSFEDVSINRLPEVDEILNTRRAFKNLETATNQTWIIAAQTARVLFPYQFDFASSRSELVNVTKMLKALHKKPREPSYVEPLPPDLWLRFESIVFEIEDDPFEVKLGDNYALLLDETKQWNTRRALLETRLHEIRMTPGNLLTVKKEDELFRKLEEKNAQLYIQRSKALYDQVPMRKNLLTWQFSSLDLRVLADDTYHGKDRAVKMMTQLNDNSPYPADGIEFITLWCRTVQGTLASHCYRLRDYPRPIFTSQSVKLSGTFMGAEQAAADRAKRDASIHIDEPWGDMNVQRSLTALKFYYDLDFGVDTLEIAWGVDTDPAATMVSLAFDARITFNVNRTKYATSRSRDYVSKASADPSKLLPFYDKMRLLLHGRLQMDIKEWLMFLSATRNPYDITERLEIEWRDVDLLWTNGLIVIDGDFDLQTRTASKYDDRRVLHLPAFKVCVDMKWNCQGDYNDHHNVMPCAPEKVPELAPNQAHDTYAAFRSQNLNLNVSLETAMDPTKNVDKLDPPTVYLYASTFRWFKKYQAVMFQNVARPIKRGPYFQCPSVKKKALGRHYKKVSLSLKFPELSVWYWGSFTQQRGIEMSCGHGSLHTQYRLQLRPFTDGLIRRHAADWSATKLHIEMSDVTSHVYGLDQPDGQEEGEEASEVSSIDLEPTKYYFLTAESLEYSRQDTTKKPKKDMDDPLELQNYSHRLVCHGLKGAWTLTNRNIIFGLFEAYTNAEILKKNLSADALKVTIVDQKKTRKDSSVESPGTPTSRSRSMSLLQKLVSERDSKFTVYTEEGNGNVQHTDIPLQGVSMCNTDDVIAHTWHIKLVNSQILLKGIETKGGVLVTAGSTTVLNRLHQPVWGKGDLFNKKTWAGTVENLQYFATVSADDTVSLESIPWLDTTIITGRQPLHKTGFDIADLADIVGSGDAVGGVVTAVVGGANAGSVQDMPQLQRIVARCGCEFYFVNFSTELDPLAREMAPSLEAPSPASSHLRVGRRQIVDTFTIRHKLLEISTNSSQYAMLIDIVNNVVLYTEPKKKEAIERLQRMRFHLQLSASEDQRGQILQLQNVVRSRQTEMRYLQRDLYELNLMRQKALENQEITEAVIQLEREIAQKKEQLNSSSSELKLMISAYKDFQMNLNTPTPEKLAPSAEPSKLAEVHFNHVSWQLNQADGQLETADVTFRDFSYSKTTLTDATIEHRFEISRCNMRNLLPNSIYKDVLSPHDVSGKGHAGRALMVRLYCRVKPPVGGIGVKEHFEVNVCPLSVQLTHRLFRKVMVFFFPQRAHEYEGEVGEEVDLVYRGQEAEEKYFDDRDMFTDDLEGLNLQLPPKSGSLKRSSSTASSISSSSETSTDFPSKSRRGMVSLSSAGDSPPTSPLGKDKGKKKSTFYRTLGDYDDLDKMKERASKNNSFIYVKVTEVSLCVSYKGEKDKNIVDVHDFNLTIPTLEYHNRTWTWHDLLMAMKKDCINMLVSQIIKEKLHLKGGHGTENKNSKSEPKEEDKVKLLFGDRSKAEKKKSKKSLLRKFVKRKHSSKNTGLLQPDGAGPEPVNLEEDEFDDEEEEELPEITIQPEKNDIIVD